MKHTKLLLIPLLFLATSCVTISQDPQGPTVDISDFETTSEVELSFYEKDNIADTIPTISESAKTISFRNDVEKVELYNQEADVKKDISDSGSILDSVQHESLGKGIYGFKLDYMPIKKNHITFKLAENVKVQYLSIKCSPAFYNVLDHETGKNEFISNTAALNVSTLEPEYKSNYVKLTPEKVDDEQTGKSKASERTITFDLKAPVNSFTLSAELYSVALYEITLF